jgi:hypothetical protein
MDRVEQDDVSEPLPTLAEGEEHHESPNDSSSQARSVKLNAFLPFSSPGTSDTFGRHISPNRTPNTLNTVPKFAIPPLPLEDSSNMNDTAQNTTTATATTTTTTTTTTTMSTLTSRRKPTVESIDEDGSMRNFASPLPQIQPKLFTNKKGALPKRSFSEDLVVDGDSPFGPRPKTGMRRSTSLDADDVRNKPFSHSPADRLSSIILPGSLGAKVSRRSQHFKDSIAQVSTNFFNRRPSDDDIYVGDTNRQEFYTRESIFLAYSVGDAVFVFTNHRFVSSVNRFGFPPGEGRTAEEKTGPYIFVLGKIQEIHFEENSVFYTVRREDTGVDVRGSPGKYSSTIRSSDRERRHERLTFSQLFYFIFSIHGTHQIEGRGRRCSKSSA